MDYLNGDSSVPLPFQAEPMNMAFHGDDRISGPGGSVEGNSMEEHAVFDESFIFHPEMMSNVCWTQRQDGIPGCSPDNAELLSWDITDIPLAYTTSNGGNSSGSSGNAPNSPSGPSRVSASKLRKAEERRERRRMQNRAAQRHFRDKRKVELKDNVERIEKMESEIRNLSGENEKMEEVIKALKRKCEGLEKERKELRKEQRVLEGNVGGEDGDTELEASEEIEKLVKGVMSEAVQPNDEVCRWHWMKVKQTRVKERGDWSEVPSIFV